MSKVSEETLVAGYLAHAVAVAHDRRDTHFWAYEGLHELVEENAEGAWPLVCQVVQRAADDATLEYVSADILEDVICAHAEAVVDRADTLARTDAHFRKALSVVRGANRMPVAVRARLDLAVGRQPQ